MLLLKNAQIFECLTTLPDNASDAYSGKKSALIPADILIDERIEAVYLHSEGGTPESNITSIDLKNRIVTPGFLDAHVHIDKAYTWDRAPNLSGTFGEAIEVLWKDKENWTKDDLYIRGSKAMQAAYDAGTVAIRTHVDTGLPWARKSHEVMAKLRREWAGKVELQTVSLCSVEQYNTSEGSDLADLPLEFGASAIGGMPVMNPQLDTQLDALMRLAAERKTDIDLHVDESADPDAQTLLAVAEAVIRNEFPNTVTCGHCCSLAVQPEDIQLKTLKKVKEAGIHIVSLPLCNLYLQDRSDPNSLSTSHNKTPFWRGITLIKEFLNQGTNVACASDNVRDAFYAYGDFDPFEVLLYSTRLAHLDDPFHNAPALVTRAPAQLMKLPDFGIIDAGANKSLNIWESTSLSEWLSRPRQNKETMRDLM